MIPNKSHIKPCLIAAFIFGFIDLVICQSTWIRKLDLDRHDSPGELIQGDSATFYLTYRYEDGSLGPVTQNLTKISYTGTEIWNLKFENNPYHVFEGPAGRLFNSDLIVCFLFEDSLTFSYQVYRINPDGEILWTNRFPFLVHQEIDYAFQFYKVIPVTPNDIRLFFRMNYYWESDPPSAKNGYISLDSLGQEKHIEYFETNGEYQWPYGIVQTQDTQFVKVSRPTLGQLELLLRFEQLDKSFTQNWSYEIGPQDEAGGGPLCTDANGNVYFTWNHDTTGNGGISNQLPSIISLNQHGEFRWITHFGEDRGIPVFYDIISTADGRIIACGQEGNTALSGGSYRTGWIACTDSDGNKLWERRYVLEEASDSGNNFYKVIESPDGGLILHGVLYKDDGGSDVYVVKTDNYGCLTEDCMLYNFVSLATETKNVIEHNFTFYLTVVSHTVNISSKQPISLEKLNYELINLNGIVITEGTPSGDITSLDISGLSPGIYFVRIYDKIGGRFYVAKFYNPD